MIVPELEKLGVTPYYYEQNKPGTPIRETIDREIAECDEFLVLLTPKSIDRPWVIDETAVAAVHRKKIVAFRMYEDAEVPPRLKNIVLCNIDERQRYYDELRERTMKVLVDEQTKVHEQEKVQEQEGEPDPARDLEFALAAVQQGIRNLDPDDLRDLTRRIVALALTKSAAKKKKKPSKKPTKKPRKKPRKKKPPEE
jgi:hypothetical protein